MISRIKHLCSNVRTWRQNCDGVVATEFALILPLLVAMLFGVYDLGMAIVINQKAITASQSMADLVARSTSVSEDDLENIASAGREAMRPFVEGDLSYNIISIGFTSDLNDPEPWLCWDAGTIETTEEMIERTAPLAVADEGVVVVTVEYDYVPVFAKYLMDTLHMSEAAYARGRLSPIVSLQEGAQEVCE